MDKDMAMVRVIENWERLRDEEGWTQQRLGEAMGYAEKSARKSVSQFLRTADPQISVLRRFANAVGVDVEELVRDKK